MRDIIAKSLAKQPLAVEETAALLAADEPELVEQIFDAARQLKRDVYGNRIVLFAPLYIGNECTNDCQYCAFRRSNREADPPHARRGRDPPAGVGPGTAGPQAADPRLRRASALRRRVHGRVRAARLRHDDRPRRNPPREHQRRPAGPRRLRDGQGGRHRHLPDLPGDLSPRNLSPGCIRPAPARATISGGSTAWPGRWRPSATTWASGPCSGCTTGGSRCSGW